ncbi:MAG: SseB family protein, partial [Clostridia bacterium]|nr:SseB family protein [Clostridia bacterium]
MGISKEEAIKTLQSADRLFVAYSQATKLPYVTCDEESGSYNDQVWIFTTEEGIKNFGQEKLKDKILLMGMGYEKKDFPRLYGTLYAIGANSVVLTDGEEQVEVELEKIARQADFSKLEPAKRPLFNPTLQLTGIYFMQELRRPLKKEERTVNLREMEEELIVNLKKSEFLVAMATDPDDATKVNIPYLKNKQGDILQPAFTDVMEFDKFARGKKLRAAKVPFAKLPGLIINQA